MEQKYQSKYQSKLRKAVIGTAAGLVLAVEGFSLGGCGENLKGWDRLGDANTTLRHKATAYFGEYNYPLEDGWILKGEDGGDYVLTREREGYEREMRTMPKKEFERKYGNLEELLKKQNHETNGTHTDRYFRNAYNNITLDKLTEEEINIFEKDDIKDMPKEQRDFISKHLMYVNLKQPSSKDFAFLIHYEELIDLYRDYKSIDMKKLSPYEIDVIKKFREENPSGKLSPNNGTTDEKELIEFLSIFVNPENMSDRDIIFSDRVVGSIAAGMMQNMGN